ncbi:MAG: hypothetical protein P9M03_03345 [Candidatus Theseobacter exili]|nr:hypothetical protein [Candidatus Theseobacter exili]
MRKIKIKKLGGVSQLAIEVPEDLDQICKLDKTHWIATSAPCDSFICDQAFLKYMDSDKNNRIRTEEIKNAQEWLFRMLSDKSRLAEKTDILHLSAIDTSHPEGTALHAAAKRILTNLKIKDSDTITLQQAQNRQDIVAQVTCNGDGIIPPESIEDPETSEVAHDIMRSMGSTEDASGVQGITIKHLDSFLQDAQAYLGWNKKSLAQERQKHSSIFVWGEDTAQAYNCIHAIKPKINEFFNLCHLIQFNQEFEKKFILDEKELEQLKINDSESLKTYLSEAPLRIPNTEEILVIDEHINPMYRNLLNNFKKTVLSKITSNSDVNKLDKNIWEKIQEVFSEYSAWQAEKPESQIGIISADTLQKHLNGPCIDKLRKLMEKDLAIGNELQQVMDLEKLILYQKWLFEFLRNFISFESLFNPASPSIIQVGALIMDGRVFSLCTKVTNHEEHRNIAAKSNICIMYLSITGKIKEISETMEIATAVTSGTMSNLYIGKNGVFFTPDGREWDAKVTDIIINPVSLSEALLMPFKKLSSFIEKNIDRFRSSKYNEMEKGLVKGIDEAGNSLSASKEVRKQSQPKASNGGVRDLVLGGSIAIAALGSSFAFITNTLKNVSLLNILSVILGLMILIAVPTIIGAYIKLRQRNLGMFLEACQWSINAPFRLTVKTGLLFTYVPGLPKKTSYGNYDISNIFLNQKPDNKNKWLKLIIYILIAVLFGLTIGYLLSRTEITETIVHYINPALSATETVNK